ncbi:AMP-dependent synthetase [Alteromonas sediminis]|uniref:AMP-dependent synthetase n=1 Tax=Alteromonas sediminis TaxID=2259342 RepID=A0A3N5Y280_9ALTE|nr:AMP-binding protein [Alteromonas sediminis]RPJ67073.1 AMP-dependent synthetase [Alteromonas sediminis]
MPLTTHAKDMQIPTALELFYKWEKETPTKPYLNQPVDGHIKTYTWSDFADRVRRLAAALKSKGFPEGSRIGVLSKNCAEWFMTDIAIMLAGHVSVPIFATAGKDTIRYVSEHADIQLMFVGKLDDTQTQVSAIPEHIPTVAYPYPDIPASQSWDAFIDIEPYAESPVPDLNAVATIIYTSGSTGQPKGVVHTFSSICWAAKNAVHVLEATPDDRVMSYLPLAHITERVLIELCSFYAGFELWFVESLDTFQRDVQTCRPTLFVSVPRLWTKFQMGILAKLPQKKLNLLLSIPIVKGLISKKIRTGLGLNETRLFGSGSAPLPPALITWFHRLGISISEGWGMTENCAYGTTCVPFRIDKVGAIGKVHPGVDLRISDEGEIQVKGPCNMREYYLEPEKTAEVFTDDGYLRTGDKGEIDADGYVRITGRLKDIFKTSKGKYVTPAPIESKFMANPIVEQVCVTGSSLPQPVALVVLSEEAAKQDRGQITAELSELLGAINGTLESHQKLDRVIVCDEPWTPENNMLTPTLKVRRHILEEKLKSTIEARYTDKVIWKS